MRKPLTNIPELLIRIGNDDMGAYEILYNHFFTPLHHFALSIIHSRQQAEEIVSDVFIKIWQARKTLHEVRNIHVYLYTSVRNRAFDYLTKEQRHGVSLFQPEDWDEVIIELKSPLDYCISTDLMQKINTVINQLPPQCKTIFRLVKEEGLSYKQVAEIMQISPLTVRNQLMIAVRKMGESLPAYIHGRSAAGSKKNA
jgi:RNA polymerase sigma-70 factor (family 1)